MDSHSFLLNAVIYLTAAVVAVPLFRALGLGAVLGYLCSGAVIGPFGIGLIRDAESILHFAELGVVLLLFVIGLELNPKRLWNMRRSVFGMGGAQLGGTAVVLALIAYVLSVPAVAAGIVGLSMALSSTAFALQILTEKNQLRTLHGQCAFSILLFQDLAVIPILALLPLVGTAGVGPAESDTGSAAQGVVVMIAVVAASYFLLGPLLRGIAASRTREIFTAATLLLVVGMALVMEWIGLSMALGSFLAGVLLADSEYRHQLEADIEPFKGLLLGLFFIAVGMSVDLSLITRSPLLIAALTGALLAVKLGLLYGLGWLFRIPREARRNLAFVLPQSGEFGFVIFGVATTLGAMEQSLADLLIVVVTMSMALTPLLFAINQRFLKRYSDISERPYDDIAPQDNQVVIAGFGRFGQIIGRILRVRGIPFTALEHDSGQVDVVRKFGNKIYYGDASRLDLLHAAGMDRARIFVLAIADRETSLQVARIVHEHFPDVKILARVRNRQHAFELLELGVADVWRETLLSSSDMGREVLQELGMDADAATDTVARFLVHDDEIMRKQAAIHRDEKELIRYSKQAGDQLERVFRADDQKPLDATK
ncbi:MAG: monovalent cation:proton antiporter-2 (CPA2) family protein [Proteobacteria bacterium]|nr:monovalent cation:proton antiporter-2 (CPA2) family protein [Pseudomonadota bacterium]